jgi:YD repeat-containing protein
MTRKNLIVMLAFVAIACSFGITALAQNNPACTDTYSYGPFGNPPGAGWDCKIVFWQNIFNFEVQCTRQKSTCPARDAKEETRDGASCPACQASKPISLVSGNTYIEQTDVRIPGLSNGLILVRTWNSMWPSTQMSSQSGLFGLNWRSNFEERVFYGNDGYYKYSRGDGSFWSFGATGSVLSVAAPANANATLVVDSNNTHWTLTFQNGEQRIFNYTSGSLTSIINRNGNATQLSYDSLNRLVTVTDPGGRHLYFGYANNSSYWVTSVTSDVGISLSYSYDSHGRLLQVTEPDQTTLSFEYASISLDYLITAVKDSNGKVLESHTYDACGRGLTGSQAGGVGAVTLSYPFFPCPNLNPTPASEF